jgi:hypothetical protein
MYFLLFLFYFYFYLFYLIIIYLPYLSLIDYLFIQNTKLTPSPLQQHITTNIMQSIILRSKRTNIDHDTGASTNIWWKCDDSCDKCNKNMKT